MSWIQTAIPILRNLIDDLDGQYSDSRLSSSLISNAYLMCNEIKFGIPYRVDVVLEEVAPDPVNDKSFISLVCLKTAASIAYAEYKIASKKSVSITDGPARVDLTNLASQAKDRHDAIALEYHQAMIRYQVNKGDGRFVTGPINRFNL